MYNADWNIIWLVVYLMRFNVEYPDLISCEVKNNVISFGKIATAPTPNSRIWDAAEQWSWQSWALVSQYTQRELLVWHVEGSCMSYLVVGCMHCSSTNSLAKYFPLLLTSLFSPEVCRVNMCRACGVAWERDVAHRNGVLVLLGHSEVKSIRECCFSVH